MVHVIPEWLPARRPIAANREAAVLGLGGGLVYKARAGRTRTHAARSGFPYSVTPTLALLLTTYVKVSRGACGHRKIGF